MGHDCTTVARIVGTDISPTLYTIDPLLQLSEVDKTIMNLKATGITMIDPPDVDKIIISSLCRNSIKGCLHICLGAYTIDKFWMDISTISISEIDDVLRSKTPVHKCPYLTRSVVPVPSIHLSGDISTHYNNRIPVAIGLPFTSKCRYY